MQEFIVIYNETDVVGYDDTNELLGGLASYNDQERKSKANEADIHLDDLDAGEAAELDFEPGDEPKVYETADVLKALNTSTLDSEDKKALMKEFKKDQIRFKVDSVFDEVIEDVDQFHGHL